ncbi:Clavaminate synthase-like protein [Aureobasidium pullulans]|nr:Clavaminate synthase-like protein [Aureobasidium pullulans]
MAKTAPFNPPSPSMADKPSVPQWIPPPATKEKHNFAELETIDLSKLDGDEKAQQELVSDVKRAIREDGFLFLENYGISLEQLHRQFSIAHYLFNNISEEDKERLLFHPSTGRWAGWKHEYGFKRHRQQKDGINQFNWYKEQWENDDLLPACVLPFMDEIRAFSEYLTKSVNRRLLTLFSRVLELPDDWLWNNVQPVNEKILEKSKNIRMHGHTDFGLTTLLFSVPISCLQIWGKDDQWHYAPYRPGALVINIGETLEIVSGGHFKATRHRVFSPPADQLQEERLSFVQFQSSVGHLRMTPAIESPLIQREGCVEDQGVYRKFKRVMDLGFPVSDIVWRVAYEITDNVQIPTNQQWREIQIAEATDPTDDQRNRIGADQVLMEGKLMQQREYMGVKVLLPV